MINNATYFLFIVMQRDAIYFFVVHLTTGHEICVCFEFIIDLST